MNNYCFFVKSEKIIAIEKSNELNIQKLIAAGYKKQFEEVRATSTKRHLNVLQIFAARKLRTYMHLQVQMFC